jgi:hypothetical protein
VKSLREFKLLDGTTSKEFNSTGEMVRLEERKTDMERNRKIN